jgi:cell division septum initiation protein DivIVA
MAWDTVNLLKDENKGLKDRVEELETAVEGALDVVNGIGL